MKRMIVWNSMVKEFMRALSPATNALILCQVKVYESSEMMVWYIYSYAKSLIRWNYQDFWECSFWEPQEAWGRRGVISSASGSTIILFDSCFRCRLQRYLRTRASPVGSSRMRIHVLLCRFFSHSQWTEYYGGCKAQSARSRLSRIQMRVMMLLLRVRYSHRLRLLRRLGT